MSNQMTLFSRYKNMINLLWADGQRKYTANELNTFVGHYENNTWWKRSNNKLFYTTRTYQTALKHLGCITKIKRGLWQINAPIPEWFGSFHINALNSKSALRELERSSIYWKSLPAEHKVNPWENIDPMRVIASMQEADLLRALEEADNAQMEDDIAGGMRNCGDFDYYTQETTNTNKQTMNKTTDFIMQTISGTTLIEEFPQLTMTTQVEVSPTADGHAVDICDYQYYIGGKEVSRETAEAIVGAYGKRLDWVQETAWNVLKAEIIEAAKVYAPDTADTKGFTKDGARYYSEAEVMEILKDFANGVKNRVTETIEDGFSGIDGDDVVDLEWDRWNKTMDISLSIDDTVRDIAMDASRAVEDVLDGYEISTVQLN